MAESKSDKVKREDLPFLIEQYRAYIDSTEKLYDHRANTNRFFITILTALSALLSFATGFFGVRTFLWATFLAVPISAVGIALCWIWHSALQAYGVSIWSKYNMIHKIEERLPYQIYIEELAESRSLIDARKAKGIKYTSISRSEKRIAKAFGVIFALLSASELALFFYQYL